ncbi:hypothetical protein E1I21_01970 [Microbacterium oleivorans]|nr:hypothetical protein E1I21_01970 [Microbacterium oleivorans]
MVTVSSRMGRDRVRAVRGDLRPGLWVKAGPLMWRRIGSGSVPGHASSTKGVASALTSRQTLAWVRDLRHAFVVTRGSGTADAAVAAHDGGTVLFDTAAHRVIRRYGSGPVTEEYVRMRTVFTSHVGAPAFVVGGDRAFLVEELVVGEHLLDVPPAARVAAIRRLISEYAQLTADAGADGPGLRELLSGVIDDLDPSSEARWRAADVGDLTDRMSWIPSAYEATAKNLMVSRGQRPVPIDLGDLQMQPFFVYPLGVLIAAGGEVLEAFRRGEFDAELAELWAAAGLEWSRDAAQRDGALVARAAFAAVRDHDAGIPGGFPTLFDQRLALIDPWLSEMHSGGVL